MKHAMHEHSRVAACFGAFAFACTGWFAGAAGAATGNETAASEAGAQRGAATQAGQAARTMSLEAPTVRIYRSVAADGSVTFSDRPEPQSTSIQIRSFASSSDSEAIATAQRQREYWKAQAEAFAKRLRERDKEDELAAAARESDPARPVVVVVPRHLRSAQVGGNFPAVGPGQVPARYTSSPGVAAGTPAGFIGSGFSTATR